MIHEEPTRHSPDNTKSDEKKNEQNLPVVLFVDDDENNLTSYVSNYRNVFKVYTANNGIEAMLKMEWQKFDVVVCDQRMEGMTGIEFLKNVAKLYPGTIRIFATGYTDYEHLMDAINEAGVYKCVFKPIDHDKLLSYLYSGANLAKAYHDGKYLLENLREKHKKMYKEDIKE
ncbi:MAG: response regulator [Bacteroidota bacterium]|nr:response regulator [Bacteroidota bacterium]